MVNTRDVESLMDREEEEEKEEEDWERSETTDE